MSFRVSQLIIYDKLLMEKEKKLSLSTLICSFLYLSADLSIHLCIYLSFIHIYSIDLLYTYQFFFIHSLINWFIFLSVRSLIYWFIHLSIYMFSYIFIIYLFIYSFIHFHKSSHQTNLHKNSLHSSSCILRLGL